MRINLSKRLITLFFLHLGIRATACQLVVSPAGPTEAIAVAGGNVTLAVTFGGAPDPTVTWSKDSLPVVTWTIGSDAEADVAAGHRDVLTLESNGSLTFRNVSVHYSGNYSVSMTKSGIGTASAEFSLKVYELFQDVTLGSLPDPPVEGAENFTLQYSFTKGVVEDQTWFLNGTEMQSNSHYSVEGQRLTVLQPKRSDTGEYAVSLSNPFSSVRASMSIAVLYGPDEPTLLVHPAKPFHVSGDSLNLTCRADGFPKPTVEWVFGGETHPEAENGVLTLVDVQTNQGGVYTCRLQNELSGSQRQGEVTVTIHERPPGEPMCSVQSENDLSLLYHCQWPGGSPLAQLSFPALSSSSSGQGNITLNVTAADSLDGKTAVCVAAHPIETKDCNITATSPVKFVPMVRTVVRDDGKIEVSITCFSKASPSAAVTWLKGGEAVGNNAMYQININTTELKILDFNASTIIQHTYNCSCRNPLGVQSREIQLLGPAISDSSLIKNPEGSVITLTWEVPPTAVVTGFDIQMKGPELPSESRNSSQHKKASEEYRIIQKRPGHVRSTDVLDLNPKSLYHFRVIPRALMVEGKPSKAHRTRQVGLSGPAIAGIAAGIPCSLLFLLLLCGLIYLCYYCWKNKSQHIPYPVSRAPEMTKSAVTIPHPVLNGGLNKSPPDYNRLHQVPSERSMALPTFVPPPPVRVATTV
ncbi:V-set and immunoglobulin domain-containing protein 10-like isoform 1-T1 [Synchiropus picturatus]